MAILNRSLDSSERSYTVQGSFTGGKDVTGAAVALYNGAFVLSGIVQAPSTLNSVNLISSPQTGSSITVTLSCIRNLTATSITFMTIGTAQAIGAQTSGLYSYSGLPAVGSTLLQFQAGDTLLFVLGAAAGSESFGINLFSSIASLTYTQDKIKLLGT